MRQRTSRARCAFSIGAIALLLLGLLGLTAVPAGAASGHYMLMTQQLARGVLLRCADVDYAAAQGLIEPVEIRWLSAAGVKCPNEQYEVMLALGTKGQLGCPDIEWNALNGLINWNQAAGLLWRVPGCELTKYAFLVTLSAQGGIGCADINWYENVGLISAGQSYWLKLSLLNQGRYCEIPGLGTRASPAPHGYPVRVGDWIVAVTGWEPDVTALVRSYNPYNDPPPVGGIYARAWVVATYAGSGTGYPFSITLNVLDQWLNTYSAKTVSSGSGGDPRRLSSQPSTVYGGTVSGAVYYAMSTGGAYGPVLGFATSSYSSPTAYFWLN
jgi:hypothetical protein